MHRQHSLGKPSSGACAPRGYDLAPLRKEAAEGKEAKVWARGNRERERATGLLTVGQPQGFEGGSGGDCVGGVDEVERGAEDA